MHPWHDMAMITLILAIANSAAWATSSPVPMPKCPDLSLGETADDCPWAAIARAFGTGAGMDFDAILDSQVPALSAKFKQDSANEKLKALWGRSINYDEFEKAEIVKPEILHALSRRLHIRWTPGEYVHAGMEHVYGYLFSTLKTRFGFKRARWVRGDIDEGFGFKEATINPLPAHGTLLGNVSYIMSRIALHRNADAAGVSSELTHYGFDALEVVRITETILAGLRKVILITDLVKFPATPTQSSNSHLLIYSVEDSAAGGQKLVTAFPVAATFVADLIDPPKFGAGKPITTRFNAYVEGVTGKTFKGTREMSAIIR